MGFKVIPLATAELMIALPDTILQNRFFSFESLGTAFRIRGVFCSSKHKGISTFQSCPLKGLCRCG